jgi:hypothetical protein
LKSSGGSRRKQHLKTETDPADPQQARRSTEGQSSMPLPRNSKVVFGSNSAALSKDNRMLLADRYGGAAQCAVSAAAAPLHGDCGQAGR